MPVFANSEQGWIILSSDQSSRADLYYTTDGGVKWYPQSLSHPKGLTSSWAVRMSWPVREPGTDFMLLLAKFRRTGSPHNIFALYRLEVNSKAWHLLSSWKTQLPPGNPYEYALNWGVVNPHFSYITFGNALWTSGDGGHKWIQKKM